MKKNFQNLKWNYRGNLKNLIIKNVLSQGELKKKLNDC